MFNHYRDIRASGKFPKIWQRWGALSTGSWALNDRWRTEAFVSENVEANFQIDVIFINNISEVQISTFLPKILLKLHSLIQNSIIF